MLLAEIPPAEQQRLSDLLLGLIDSQPLPLRSETWVALLNEHCLYNTVERQHLTILGRAVGAIAKPDQQ